LDDFLHKLRITGWTEGPNALQAADGHARGHLMLFEVLPGTVETQLR